MLRSRRVLTVAICSLGLMAGGCQEDSPEQEVPPGIFTTTLGSTPPTTAAPADGSMGY